MPPRVRLSAAEFGATLTLVLITALLESALLVAWLEGRLSGAMALAVHAVLVLPLLYGTVALGQMGRDARVAHLLSLSVAVLGPIGAIGGALACVTLFAAQGRAALFDAWQRALAERDVASASSRARRAVVRGPESLGGSKQSLWAVMRHGNYVDKLRLTGVLARRLQRESVPLIHDALEDSDPAVRVQAATVVEKHEHAFTREWVKREAAARTAPNDARAYYELGRCCDDYAYLGLVDARRVMEIRVRGRAAYEDCLRTDPNHLPAAAALLRLLVRSGAFREAGDVYQRYQGRLAPEAMLWRCEGLFGLGDFATLRQLVVSARHSGLLAAVPGRVRAAVELWADPGRERAAAGHGADALVCVLPSQVSHLERRSEADLVR